MSSNHEFDEPVPGDANVMRDLSELSHHEMVDRIIEHCHAAGLEIIVPGDTLHEVGEVSEYHNRLQQIQTLDTFEPERVRFDIIKNATQRYGRNPLEANFNSLDALMNRKGPAILQLDRLKELKLSRPHQVLLLRSVIIATTSRYYEAELGGRPFSERQRLLQRRALVSLRHLATNRVHVPADITPQSRQRFEAQYGAAWLARAVERELHPQGRLSYSTTSVDQALALPIAFGQLQSGDQAEVLSIFPPGEGKPRGEHTGYKAVHPGELDDERIKQLRSFQHEFGGPLTVFRYFESVKPFQRSNSGGKKKAPGGTKEPVDSEPKEHGEYLVLTIEQPEEDDHGRTTRRTHVVADNPEKGNACYALREEILDEWEALLGIRLSWRDVFAHSRFTARQFGARNIHHHKDSNVPQRVTNYLLQETESLVLETFDTIFNQEAGLFDSRMRPTAKNTLPQPMLDQIHRSIPLRSLWPLIREFGYSETYRLLNANEHVREKVRRTVRQTTLKEHAAQIWAQVLRGEVDSD